MCIKTVAKVFKSWYSIVIAIVGLAVSVTVWSNNEHDNVVVECQSRIDRACDSVKDRFAPIEDVRFNTKVLERMEAKLDELLKRTSE